MSKPQWTPEQLDAISSRGNNLLVAAAAGAGKTAVLVERIIRHLTEVDSRDQLIDVDNLLVLTFTNAAAAEMRSRIAEALAKKLSEVSQSKSPDKGLVAHLNRQLALIGNASITTLHSFCLEIVRRYFYRIDLDPGFRIANENEIALLKLEVLEKLFEELYSDESDNVFLHLVDAYGGARGDEELFEIILKLQNFSRSMPWPEKWLKDVAAAYVVDPQGGLDKFTWIQSLLKSIKFEIQGALQKILLAQKIAQKPNGPSVYIQNFEEDLEIIEGLMWENSWQSLASKISSFGKFPNLKQCRDKSVDESLKNQAKDLRNKAKDVIMDIRKKYFVTTPEEVIDDLNMLAPIVKGLVELTIRFDNAFASAKQEKAMVDFNDLEHYCFKVLLAPDIETGQEMHSDAAIALREQFAEVLVDEYQDINPLQDIILRLVSRQGAEHPNLFMVGDVKQSIYRFRLTEPELFLEKYFKYPTQKGSAEYRIDLAANFRSRKSVLDSVNYIFRQIMSKEVGEIDYDTKAELVGGAAYQEAENIPTSSVELHIINRKKEDDASPFSPKNNIVDGEVGENDAGQALNNEKEELDASQLEARLLARRISRMVEGDEDKQGAEFQVFDKHLGCYRQVTYRDIVILLRATRGWANTLIEEFRNAGIPSYAELGSGYFEAMEIETMLALLQVIDNPRQDIPLAGVLRSPVVGLDASALSTIRLADMKGDFFDALKAAAEVSEGDANTNFNFKLKLNIFLDRLEKWRTAARQGPLTELIWQIYRETGYYDYVGGMPGGSQRQANLRALYDRALEYEATNLRGLFRFLRFIERIKDKGNDLGAARSLGENENVVRIMSIHKSKGLEFPVVIVAGMGKGFNFMDINNKYLLHKKEGLAIDAVDLDLRIAYPTLFKKALQQKIKLETLAEEMRLLYVAMTRAREKLILVGSLKDVAKELEKWSQSLSVEGWKLPDYEMAKATCYMHWVGASVFRHRNAHALQAALGIAENLDDLVAADSSEWEIFVHDLAHVPGIELTDDLTDELLLQAQQLEPVSVRGKDYEKIAQWLSWKYPLVAVTTKPAKTAVTEIKRRFDPLLVEEDEAHKVYKPTFARPRFMQKSKGLTPAEKGSLVHLVMQHINLREPVDSETVSRLLEDMLTRELITQEQVESVNIHLITNFFSSKIGSRMLFADVIKRELPFTMALPAADVYSDLKEKAFGEEVIIQGVIDCIFEEEDGFVLLDYKTDRVSDNEEEIAKRYRGQLNLYAHAIEVIYKKPVKEKWLYLFNTGMSIQVT